MTKRIIFIAIIICCVAASCENSLKSTVVGWWSIDTVYYRNYEIRSCLLVNSVSFNKDGSVSLPIPQNYCSELISEYNDKGNWEILPQDKQSLFLSINSKNVIFRGKHQIVFRRDEENGLLMMEIISDSLYVLCRKGLFNYDRNQKLVADLEKMSGGTPFIRQQQLYGGAANDYSKVPDDSISLQTGWYYVKDTGLKRELYRSKEIYLINPDPIVTSKNVVSSEIYESNVSEKSFGLKMQLDEKGAKAWSIATERATNQQVAFILNNYLLQVATVNGQIDGGVTALNRDIYTKQDLDSFKTLIISK